jgi:predicted negative regulator of RcsB-dependent stress response
VDDLQSEKEQIEEMRAWWSEYGKVVIAGVVIGIAGLIGFNQYNASKLESQVAASELYETLVEHVVDGDLDGAKFVADDLVANYADTAYAAQSKLALARLYMDQNRDQDAADSLRALLAMPADKGLQNIGRLRLAKVLLYQDKAQEVVDLLEGLDDPSFAALKNEALGDAYAVLADYELAAEAYNRALTDPSPSPTIDPALVQMKLIDLPEVVVAEAGQQEQSVEPEVVAEPESSEQSESSEQTESSENPDSSEQPMAEDGESE